MIDQYIVPTITIVEEATFGFAKQLVFMFLYRFRELWISHQWIFFGLKKKQKIPWVMLLWEVTLSENKNAKYWWSFPAKVVKKVYGACSTTIDNWSQINAWGQVPKEELLFLLERFQSNLIWMKNYWQRKIRLSRLDVSLTWVLSCAAEFFNSDRTNHPAREWNESCFIKLHWTRSYFASCRLVRSGVAF